MAAAIKPGAEKEIKVTEHEPPITQEYLSSIRLWGRPTDPYSDNLEMPALTDDSDNDEPAPNKRHRYSASTAATSCGSSSSESDADSDDEQESFIQALRATYCSRMNDRLDPPAKIPTNAPPYTTINACIARSVGREEMNASVRALKSKTTAWAKLRDQNVWDTTCYKNYHQVMYEAKIAGKYIHIGKLFGLCVEKSSELPDDDIRKKFKCRVAFQSNRVVDQNMDEAQFQDFGSALATVEASRLYYERDAAR